MFDVYLVRAAGGDLANIDRLQAARQFRDSCCNDKIDLTLSENESEVVVAFLVGVARPNVLGRQSRREKGKVLRIFDERIDIPAGPMSCADHESGAAAQHPVRSGLAGGAKTGETVRRSMEQQLPRGQARPPNPGFARGSCSL